MELSNPAYVNSDEIQTIRENPENQDGKRPGLAASDVAVDIEPTAGPSDDADVKFEQWATKQLTSIAGNNEKINYQQFKKAIDIRQSYFAERYFNILDKDGDGEVQCSQVVSNLCHITRGRPTEKLSFLFKVYDKSGTGAITKDDLRTVLKACMLESSLKLSEDNLDVLADAIFDAADHDNTRAITFNDLKEELEKTPEILENLQISGAQWLKASGKKKRPRHRYLTSIYYQNNLKKVIFRLLCLILSGLAFFWGAYNFRDSNGFLMTARGGGMALNFNCMFVLVFMLRKSITVLRSTWIRKYLPLDHHFTLHRLVAWEIFVFTVIHTAGHIGNAAWLAERTNYTMADVLFSDEIKLGLIPGCAFISGWVLFVILIIMILFSLPCVRRSGKFELFYWTHLLYFGFWFICILHGPNFWKWFVAPGAIFLFEKLSEFPLVKLVRQGKYYIKEVHILPSGVTQLNISKPSNMDFRPGDYVFLKVDEISRREWHPFTISSAPEVEGIFTLHIRSAGNWTKNLYEYFDNLIENTRGKGGRQGTPKAEDQERRSIFARLSMKGKRKIRRRFTVKNKPVNIQVHVRGPYGTPTREIFDTEHAVLVGAGIGVTPFASILQSIMYRYKASKRTCPSCAHSFYDSVPSMTMKLRKVDFVWVNRNQKEFEWFLSLLTQLETEQAEMQGLDRIIDMHMFMTAAAKRTDMKGVFLQMALSLIHKKQNMDLVTGLKTRLQPGRPDWPALFTKFSQEERGSVKVFFCGPPALGKSLMENCQKFGFDFSKETF